MQHGLPLSLVAGWSECELQWVAACDGGRLPHCDMLDASEMLQLLTSHGGSGESRPRPGCPDRSGGEWVEDVTGSCDSDAAPRDMERR